MRTVLDQTYHKDRQRSRIPVMDGWKASHRHRQGSKSRKKNEHGSTRNCNLLIANDNRSQTRYHCATHPSRSFLRFSVPSEKFSPKNSRAGGSVCLRTSFYGEPTSSIRYGVTANIAAFHAAARGSIPRIGVPFFRSSIPGIWTLGDQGIMGEGEL